MTEENFENEKSREKYYYVDKKKTCKFLCTLLASFLGTLLALWLFAAMHKPPMPPAGHHMFNPPCPCGCMDRGRHHGKIMPPGEFNERNVNREHNHLKGEGWINSGKDIKGKRLPQGNVLRPDVNNDKQAPTPPIAKPDKK